MNLGESRRIAPNLGKTTEPRAGPRSLAPTRAAQAVADQRISQTPLPCFRPRPSADGHPPTAIRRLRTLAQTPRDKMI
jgi:hypothetical protein